MGGLLADFSTWSSDQGEPVCAGEEPASLSCCKIKGRMNKMFTSHIFTLMVEEEEGVGWMKEQLRQELSQEEDRCC